MKVRELIRKLKNIDPDWDVVIASDMEGNTYATVGDLNDNCVWNGESVYVRVLTPEHRKAGYSEDDLYHGEGGKDCVVIYPS